MQNACGMYFTLKRLSYKLQHTGAIPLMKIYMELIKRIVS